MPGKPVVLIIRDGWGINPRGAEFAQEDGNATLLASTPFHEELYATYPMSTLSASGEDVGLPAGQMGNSEVGHLNLGAGRIVYQDLTRIDLAVRDGELCSQPALAEALRIAAGSRLHLIGLLSDGGVHSHQEHLIALTKCAREAGVSDVMVHAITDGRDTSPTGGKAYLEYVVPAIEAQGARVATLIGRYWAMDRDKRWDRTKLAWDAIVLGRGELRAGENPAEVAAAEYAKGETDEFLKPFIFAENDQQRVRDGDVIVFFNFRADRARQLSNAFLFPDFLDFDREVTPQVHYVTMTEYSQAYSCPVIFGSDTLDNILGQVVSQAGLTQLRIAETEKYPHVTYFFNGGVEEANPGEDRIVIQSPKQMADGTPVKTYDQMPQMSAPEVTDTLVPRLKDYDLVILNFANPDMVGHTGVVEAAVKAVETIDGCTKRVLDEVLRLGGCALVTADHGNCEMMRNADGSPNTAHTTNLVHFIYVGADYQNVTMANGILADVAPSLLALLGVPQPAEMTGKSLVSFSE